MLFSLPPELLLLIFEFVGSLNFRRDLRRLHVSRNWYLYARPVLLGNLIWSTRDSVSIFRAMRENSAALATAQQLTKHIDLTLHAGIPCLEVRTRVDPRNLKDLERLASIFKSFAALRTLIIRSGLCLCPMPSHVVPSFASLSQLTSLEMDLVHMELDLLQDPHYHLCESISRLIPSLKSLRCRLPHICEKLIESPPGNLKELIISINPPFAWTKYFTSTKYLPLHCRDHRHHPVSNVELRTRLETRLLRIADSMHKPKIVRLIYKDRWSDDRAFALDATKNRRERPDWDEDGVPAEGGGW